MILTRKNWKGLTVWRRSAIFLSLGEFSSQLGDQRLFCSTPHRHWVSIFTTLPPCRVLLLDHLRYLWCKHPLSYQLPVNTHHDLKLLKYTYTFIKSVLSFHYPLWCLEAVLKRTQCPQSACEEENRELHENSLIAEQEKSPIANFRRDSRKFVDRRH